MSNNGLSTVIVSSLIVMLTLSLLWVSQPVEDPIQYNVNGFKVITDDPDSTVDSYYATIYIESDMVIVRSIRLSIRDYSYRIFLNHDYSNISIVFNSLDNVTGLAVRDNVLVSTVNSDIIFNTTGFGFIIIRTEDWK